MGDMRRYMWRKRRQTWKSRMKKLRQLRDQKHKDNNDVGDENKDNNDVGDENNNHNSDIDKEIPPRLVLSEEINIYDNLSPGSDAYNSSAQYVRSSIKPEYVCIMHSSAQYVCSSWIETEFEKPCIPTTIPENLPCVCIMHPSGQPYSPITIEGITAPCLLSIGFYDVETR